MTSRSWFRPKNAGYQKIEDQVEDEAEEEVEEECTYCVSSLLEHDEYVQERAEFQRAVDREKVLAAQDAMARNGLRSFRLVHDYLAASAKYHDRTPMVPIP
jgi:hypothetical protein